MQMVFSELA